MKQHPFRLNAIAALFTAGSAALAPAAYSASADSNGADAAASAEVVVVSGTRVGHASFDLPAAIDVLDAARIRDGQARVNASEALAAVPGLVAQNRQNYAQDLQISSRGFGARSAFGVRGVRLIADGIPASMPDGQGQAATFNLDMAERIEVLRGPFSAIYGNHSGGVIQLFTRDGDGAPTLETTLVGGSDGARKLDLNARGKAGAVGYVLDASRFDTDGYRSHSAARREQAMAKLTLAPLDGAKLTIVANGLRQHDTQDPLGVQWATFLRDPRAGEIDSTDTQSSKRTFAERYDTRKSIDHQQLGASWEQRFGDDRLRVTAYAGNRQVIQYQAFSKGFQAPASHSGGVVDFDRDFYGSDINWLHVVQLAGGKLSTTIGIDYGRSSDARQGYENFVGAQFGVRGKLRRDERDTVSSVDPYVQTEWQSGPWLLSAGLRHSRMKVEVDDHFASNGNDSGSLSYSHTTPVLGLLYQVSPRLNVYASAARGFEAPTLNELFYSGAAAGFNFNLKAAQSTHLEAGVKARLDQGTRMNAALFQVRTSDELVVDSSNGGRTSYRNASSTLRQGAELSLDSSWKHGFSSRLALTTLRAVYQQGFGAVQRGSRLPGVPNANAYSELAWKDSAERFGAALEAQASSRIYAEDANLDRPAPGYGILNARVNASQNWGGWRFKQFIRVNNLLDKVYVGSLIVGDTNKRYYEAAPGRNWLLGASAQYAF
ncbi:TonB-dependent receptor family protein [Rugamonas rubra]|uniref:Iron complex outermembrane recepter protein n=1 Tax=Rugamonas rubra TaxID=758825 RepID=A0A1I4UM90_9BURK|nr:TonB-dependent receptor [Rugamonas rubra]SFM90031.1 iron complex outermembrane recepter protein [Rugamonas rubra]